MPSFTPPSASSATFALLVVLTASIFGSGDGMLTATEQVFCDTAPVSKLSSDVDYPSAAPEVSQDSTGFVRFAETSVTESVPLAITQAKRTLSIDRLRAVNTGVDVLDWNLVFTVDAVLAAHRPVSLTLLNIRLQV